MNNKVQKGNRNHFLMGVGVKQALMGVTQIELRNFLYQYNEKNCDPPLEKYEIKAMVGDIMGASWKKPDFLSFSYKEDEKVKKFLKLALKYVDWAKEGEKIDYIDIEGLINSVMYIISHYEKRIDKLEELV